MRAGGEPFLWPVGSGPRPVEGFRWRKAPPHRVVGGSVKAIAVQLGHDKDTSIHTHTSVHAGTHT